MSQRLDEYTNTRIVNETLSECDWFPNVLKEIVFVQKLGSRTVPGLASYVFVDICSKKCH